VVPLVVPLEPDDWLVVEPCDVDDDEFTSVDCWLALVGPLVTLCDPLPTFTPGLMFAPALTSELLTPTFASTPTFGLTLRVLPALPDDVVLPGDVLELLGDVLELLGDVLEPLGVALDELLPGAMLLPERLMSRLSELEELLEGDVAEPFRLRLLELDELLGAEAAPFTLMSVELDELLGVGVLPFRLMSVELEEEPGVMLPFSVVEDEDEPGAAIPGATLVVVLLLAPASGTLGMHPAGCVFSASMHFGSSRSVLTLVMVSARATPKAASIEAAKRLILNVLRFICIASWV
jgi:hypothetical protein